MVWVAFRGVIYTAGAGKNTGGRRGVGARYVAVGAGITINGRPIETPRPTPGGGRPPFDLDRYYEQKVIGGPGAFIVVAENYTSFASAVLSKLLLEIAGDTPPRQMAGVR
jgi:hypothetical protein